VSSIDFGMLVMTQGALYATGNNLAGSDYAVVNESYGIVSFQNQFQTTGLTDAILEADGTGLGVDNKGQIRTPPTGTSLGNRIQGNLLDEATAALELGDGETGPKTNVSQFTITGNYTENGVLAVHTNDDWSDTLWVNGQISWGSGAVVNLTAALGTPVANHPYDLVISQKTFVAPKFYYPIGHNWTDPMSTSKKILEAIFTT
jgi:hypothetical protein